MEQITSAEKQRREQMLLSKYNQIKIEDKQMIGELDEGD